jgi:hypothetical protein
MSNWHAAVALQRLIESGRLRARMTSDLAIVLERPPAPPEPWVTKEGLAAHLACSTRWLADRMADGMPASIIAGSLKFRVTECERWLETNGHIKSPRLDRGEKMTTSANGGATAQTARPQTTGR